MIDYDMIITSELSERIFAESEKIFKGLAVYKFYYAIVEARNNENITIKELLSRLDAWDAQNLLEVLRCM